MNIKELEEMIYQANHMYRLGKPIISDSDYDKLVEQLPEDHHFRNKPEPEPMSYKGHITHTKPMLSMQKAKTDEDISKWIKKVIIASHNIGFASEDVWISINAKLDGIACVYENGKFITRGNGLVGNDITKILDKGIRLEIPDEKIGDRVLGELVVDLEYFEKHLSREFSNARNFVAGAVMSDKLNSYTERAFIDKAVVFQSYAELPEITYTIDSLLDNFREAESIIWNDKKYLIDGVILTVINEKIQKAMGETEHHPNYAIALKPKDESYITEIEYIEWKTGRTGRVTPTAILKPIDIDGVKVSRATAHNAKNVIDMGLKPGVKVEVIRSGSVIPYIVGVVNE